MADPVLAADIGATNARFALVEAEPGPARIVFERIYPTAGYPDFEPALRAFLEEAQGAHRARATRAAIAFAGTIDGSAGRLTNRAAWTIELRLLEALGFRARLLNDFQALAHGVARIGAQDYVVLQAGKPHGQASVALVGAGTGLGVASLVWDGERYRPQASEGGHMGFAPRDELEAELWRHLESRYGRASAERVLSGNGLAAIHGFLRLRSPGAAAPATPAEISAQALADPASLSGQALSLFVRCYGAFAGDIALAFLARGGLYVCGGIAAKLAQRFQQGDFIAAFTDKGRHRELVASIPVRLVTNEKLGLIGAAHAALEQG